MASSADLKKSPNLDFRRETENFSPGGGPSSSSSDETPPKSTISISQKITEGKASPEGPVPDPVYTKAYLNALKKATLRGKATQSDLLYHPVADMVHVADTKNEAMFAVDKAGAKDIADRYDLGFVVFCGLPSDEDMLSDLASWAECKFNHWTTISPAYGYVFSDLFGVPGKRVIACALTERAYYSRNKEFSLRIDSYKKLIWHPVTETVVALSAEKVKWGFDKSSVDDITRSIAMGESAFLVLCGDPSEMAMLSHLPALADFKRVPWSIVDPDWGDYLGHTHSFQARVFACSVTVVPTTPGDEDEVESEEKTGKLNPEPYPQPDFDWKGHLYDTVEEAFHEGKLVYDCIHEVTKTVAMGKSKSALVVIAADADPYGNLLHLIPLAKYMGVPYIFAPSQEDLCFDFREHLRHPISACCVLTEGEYPLRMALMFLLGTLRACKDLPHWNGMPEFEIKPKVPVRLVQPPQKVGAVEHEPEVVELGSFFDEDEAY